MKTASIRQVPARFCDGRLFVWHVRESDGCNLKAEPMEGESLAWALANPEATQAAIDAGRKWHRAASKLKYK